MIKLRKQKYIAIILISLVFLLIENKQITVANEDYLVVRVVDAEFPYLYGIYPEANHTIYEFNIELEIENPTNSTITEQFVCGPHPYPQMEAILVDDSISALVLVNHEWVAGEYSYPPGISDKNTYFGMIVENYENARFPLGEYRIWYNFTYCSSIQVTVISQALIIKVTEANITFTYEYNNQTEIVSTIDPNKSIPTDTTIGFNLEIINLFIPLIMIVKYITIKKRKKKKSWNN